MTIFWWAAAICAGAYLLAFCWRPVSFVRSGVKTASVGLIAITVWSGGGPGLLIAALALGALGDWFLSRQGESSFLFGVGAFAAAHVAYSVLALTQAESEIARLADGPRWIAASILLIFAGLMAPQLWARAKGLRAAVLAYLVIIVSMGIAALTLPWAGWYPLVICAAACFILSDAVLATELFLLPRDHPALRFTPFVIWISYWGAQSLFAIGFG